MPFDGVWTIPLLLEKKPAGVVLSASQIDKYDLCKRKWAFEYIWKLRQPPNASALLGLKVHDHLEKWLRDATPPPADTKAGKIATKMLVHLPPPGSGVVERHFYMQSARGIFYTGKIDWSAIIALMATVIDHKTSGDINKYGLTEADLPTNIQAVMYAMAAFAGFNTDTVRLFWNYGETKGRFATKPVSTVVHLPVIAPRFEVIEEVAAEMVWHRNANTQPFSFPPTPDACGAYGGCPHRDRCNLTDAEMIGGLMETPGQTMEERMRATTPGANGTPPQTGAPPQPGAPPQQPAQQPPQPGVAPQQPMQQQPAPPQPGQQPMQQPGIPGAAPIQQPGVQQPPLQQAPLQQPPLQQAPLQQAPMQPPGPMPMAPPGPPQQPAGAPPPPGQLAPGQQPPQPGQVAPPGPDVGTPPYAPDLAPNPPESGVVAPDAPAAEAGKKGRPPGSRNKTLTIDQQVFMIGVTAAINAGGPGTPQEQLMQAGELALSAFKAKFG
jgi:hypothetical protein